MDGRKISVLKFLRNVVIVTLLVGLLFGITGFLLSGKTGFANLIPFGLVIGFFASLLLSFAILVGSYAWGGSMEGTTVKQLGEWWWFIKESQNKDTKDV
jgi:hypothetical protein